MPGDILKNDLSVPRICFAAGCRLREVLYSLFSIHRMLRKVVAHKCATQLGLIVVLQFGSLLPKTVCRQTVFRRAGIKK
jgi:hypothetical protein